MSRLFIPVPEEFDYQQNLEFLKRSPRELLHKVTGDQVTKAVRFKDEKILINVRPGKSRLIIDFLTAEPSAEAKNFCKEFVSKWFDLATNLKPFYQMAEKDKLLKPLVEKFYGYRIVGQPDLFESIVWAVIGQQINLSFAYTLKERFVQHFGERLLHNNESFYFFPKPRLVAQLSNEQLLKLQFSRQKAKYTIGIAEAFSQNLISQDKLSLLSLQEAKELLMTIKGIGNWTANYALMKTFRYADAFPLEDAGIHNAIKNLLNLKRKPSLDEVKKVFKKYKGWEAYTTLYLWKSL